MLCVINADAAGLKILKAKYRPGFSPGLFSIKKTTCRATFPATDLKKVYDGEKEKIKNPLKRDREKRRRKENADDLSFAKGKVPPLCRRAWESILGGKAMIERVETRHGLRQLSYMKELGMGNDLYTIIDIDNGDAEITVEDITRGIEPVWTPDEFNTFLGRNRARLK